MEPTAPPKPATYLGIISMVVAFYLVTAPALRAWLFVSYFHSSSSPPPYRHLIEAYNLPLTYAYHHFHILRAPMDTYFNWLCELFGR